MAVILQDISRSRLLRFRCEVVPVRSPLEELFIRVADPGVVMVVQTRGPDTVMLALGWRVIVKGRLVTIEESFPRCMQEMKIKESLSSEPEERVCCHSGEVVLLVVVEVVEGSTVLVEYHLTQLDVLSGDL